MTYEESMPGVRQQALSAVSYCSESHIEKLQRIIQVSQHRKVTFTEAEEIGASLITFFEILAANDEDLNSE